MADDFGLKIGLEGEKEFKKALSEINQSFKVLGSEMKVVTSQFDKNDNSVQALTARNQVLNKEIEAQKQKIETLRSALANASESFGENDRRTQQWQIQLNNATAALNDRRVGNTAKETEIPKLRVAAYCRVSTDSDEQATILNSAYTLKRKTSIRWMPRARFCLPSWRALHSRKASPYPRT